MYRTPYEEEMDAEAGAAYGDPRRCPRHPHVQTSSPDGFHDAPCGECEAESEREADDLREVAQALRFGSHALAAESVAAFVEGGHAVFTLVSKRSGDRFTYKVAPPPPSDRPSTVRFFVSVLNGPNNEGDYAYLGCVYLDGAYRHGKRSRIPADAPSAKGFEWFWPRRAALPADRCEVHHMGTCGRCGRALTVPESITTGLGPVCAAKAAEGR